MIQSSSVSGTDDVRTAPESGADGGDVELRIRQRHRTGALSHQESLNVGSAERAASVGAGAVLAWQGLKRGTVPGLLFAAVGGGLIHRGVTGRCRVYSGLGIDTAHSGSDRPGVGGIHVATAFAINKPADELYRFWRDFQNLPRIMSHLEQVDILDERKSHWVVKAPKMVGGKVEWDAELTHDEPGRLIAWRSLPGSTIDASGAVRFTPALGERGTEVHVVIDYNPPGGRLGHWVASMLGENPKRLVREDLRNFKTVMEIGELPSILGQPAGTCRGEGKRYTESQWKPLFS